MIETRNIYEQLLERFQAELAGGHWEAGARFPSERELAQRYGVSRVTVNKVMSKLVSEGWLELRRGIGTFAAERPTLMTSLRQMESFTSFAAAQGFEPRTKVAAFERQTKVEAWVSNALGLKAGERVLFIRRLRQANGDTVIFEERWLPGARFPRLTAKALEGSFYDLCATRYGCPVCGEISEMRAVVAPTFPGLNWTGPALRIEGTGLDAGGKVLYAQRLFYRGDRFTLLNRNASAAGVPALSLCMNPNPTEGKHL